MYYIGKSTFGTPKLVHYSEVVSIVSIIQRLFLLCPLSKVLQVQHYLVVGQGDKMVPRPYHQWGREEPLPLLRDKE